MSEKPFYMTTAELAAQFPDNVPQEFQLDAHLIWNSPAALDFNSPGAQGFGVKRAGLSIPGSIMLLISPGCCGRNTAALRGPGHYGERFAFYELQDNDIVTGRHLRRIPEAVEAFVASRKEKPSVVMLCLTCVDALLGTDMERICRQAEKKCGLPVRPCYMYALTRDGSHPPMVAVREAIYSLLEPKAKDPQACNLLGYFAPIAPKSELPSLLQGWGVRRIRQLATCESYDAYQQMATANFNLVLDSEARDAARQMEKRLQIPSIELRRTYQPDRIAHQYRALAQILGITSKRHIPWRPAIMQDIHAFREQHGELHFAIGSRLNANPFDLALAFVRGGLTVEEIFANPRRDDAYYIRQLGQLSPATRIYTNLSPTMVNYEAGDSHVTFALGEDACWYHPDVPGIGWHDEIQPFGFTAIHALLDAMRQKLGSAQRPVQQLLHAFHFIRPVRNKTAATIADH